VKSVAIISNTIQDKGGIMEQIVKGETDWDKLIFWLEDIGLPEPPKFKDQEVSDLYNKVEDGILHIIIAAVKTAREYQNE
jgi:hypothetical protein